MSAEWEARALNVIDEQLDRFVLLLDREMNLMYISRGVEKVLGWRPEARIGRGANEFIHSNDLHLLMRSSFEDHSTNRELRMLAADRTWVRCLARPLTMPQDHDGVGFEVTTRPGQSLFERAMSELGTEVPLYSVLRTLLGAVDQALPRTRSAVSVGTNTIDYQGPTHEWMVLAGRTIDHDPTVDPAEPRLVRLQELDRLLHPSVLRSQPGSAWLVPIMLPHGTKPLATMVTLNEVVDPQLIDVEQVLRPAARLIGIAIHLHMSQSEIRHLLSTNPVTGQIRTRRMNDWLNDKSELDKQAVTRVDIHPLTSADNPLSDQETDFIAQEIEARIRATIRPYDSVTRHGSVFFVTFAGVIGRTEARRATERLQANTERPVGLSSRIVDLKIEVAFELRRGNEEINAVIARINSARQPRQHFPRPQLATSLHQATQFLTRREPTAAVASSEEA